MKKEKKDFSLYKKPSGIYYVRKWDEDTKTYSSAKSTHEKDRDKAVIKADEMIKGGQIKKKESDPLFIYQIKEYWKNKKSLSPKYQKHTISYIEKYFYTYPKFKKLKLSNLKAGHINRFIDYLETEKELTPRVINRILQSIKTFINWALLMEYIEIDFTKKIIKKKKEGLRKRGELTPPEVIKISSLNWPDQRIKVAVLLGIFAGMRRGEIRALRWKDVDFDTNMIYIRQNFTGDYDRNGKPIFKEPKAGSEAALPFLIFPELRQAILELWEQTPFREPDNLLLCNVWHARRKNGTDTNALYPLADSTLKRDFHHMLEAIGINEDEQERRHLTFHSTRHTAASFLDRTGSTKTAMKATRHKTRDVFEEYSHANIEDVTEHLKQTNAAYDVYRKEPENIIQ